eukprot:Opistho-2@39703
MPPARLHARITRRFSITSSGAAGTAEQQRRMAARPLRATSKSGAEMRKQPLYCASWRCQDPMRMITSNSRVRIRLTRASGAARLPRRALSTPLITVSRRRQSALERIASEAAWMKTNRPTIASLVAATREVLRRHRSVPSFTRADHAVRRTQSRRIWRHICAPTREKGRLLARPRDAQSGSRAAMSLRVTCDVILASSRFRAAFAAAFSRGQITCRRICARTPERSPLRARGSCVTADLLVRMNLTVTWALTRSAPCKGRRGRLPCLDSPSRCAFSHPDLPTNNRRLPLALSFHFFRNSFADIPFFISPRGHPFIPLCLLFYFVACALLPFVGPCVGGVLFLFLQTHPPFLLISAYQHTLFLSLYSLLIPYCVSSALIFAFAFFVAAFLCLSVSQFVSSFAFCFACALIPLRCPACLRRRPCSTTFSLFSSFTLTFWLRIASAPPPKHSVFILYRL